MLTKIKAGFKSSSYVFMKSPSYLSASRLVVELDAGAASCPKEVRKEMTMP